MRRILTVLFLFYLVGEAIWLSLGWLQHNSPMAKPWAGPWKAQVIDAETGKPLEGVVVLAWWTKYYNSVGGEAGGEYYASEEVVTGTDGRFVIEAQRWVVSLLPLITIFNGPEFRIFKPGYGQLRFQGTEGWEKLDLIELEERAENLGKRFAKGEELEIELPPLKTSEEREKFFRTLSMPDVPSDYMRHLERAWKEEWAHLYKER